MLRKLSVAQSLVPMALPRSRLVAAWAAQMAWVLALLMAQRPSASAVLMTARAAMVMASLWSAEGLRARRIRPSRARLALPEQLIVAPR